MLSFKKYFQLRKYKRGLSLFTSKHTESAHALESVMQLSGFPHLVINTSNTQHTNDPFGYSLSASGLQVRKCYSTKTEGKKIQLQLFKLQLSTKPFYYATDKNNFVSGI